MEVSGFSVNKFLMFSKKKAFLIFFRNGNHENVPYIPRNRKPKKLLIFKEELSALKIRKEKHS